MSDMSSGVGRAQHVQTVQTPTATPQNRVSTHQNPLGQVGTGTNPVNTQPAADPPDMQVSEWDKTKKEVKKNWNELTQSKFGRSTFARGTAGFLKGLSGYSMAKRAFNNARQDHTWMQSGKTGFYTRYNDNSDPQSHDNRGSHIGSAMTLGVLPAVVASISFLAGKIATAISGPAHSTPQVINDHMDAENHTDSVKITQTLGDAGTNIAGKTNRIETAMRMMEGDMSPGIPLLPDSKSVKDSMTLRGMTQKDWSSENLEMIVMNSVFKEHPTKTNFDYLMDNFVSKDSTKEINISFRDRQNYEFLKGVGYDNLQSVFQSVPDDVRTAYKQNPDDTQAKADFSQAMRTAIENLQNGGDDQPLTRKDKTKLEGLLISDNTPKMTSIKDIYDTASEKCVQVLRPQWDKHFTSEIATPPSWNIRA